MEYMGIFDRLFGRAAVSESTESVEPVARNRAEDPEILALRERNLGKAMEMFLDRPATAEEFAIVRREMTGGDASKDLESLSIEEMRGRVAKIWQHLGRVPEIVPVAIDVYELMGNRQGNFERSLAVALGRDLTETDLAEARGMFEDDEAIQSSWPTLVGEEVSHYAQNVARRMLSERLKNPDSNGADRIAAK